MKNLLFAIMAFVAAFQLSLGSAEAGPKGKSKSKPKSKAAVRRAVKSKKAPLPKVTPIRGIPLEQYTYLDVRNRYGVKFHIGDAVGWNGHDYRGAIVKILSPDEVLIATESGSRIPAHPNSLIKPVDSLGSVKVGDYVYSQREQVASRVRALYSNGDLLMDDVFRFQAVEAVETVVSSLSGVKAGDYVWISRNNPHGNDRHGHIETVFSRGSLVVRDGYTGHLFTAESNRAFGSGGVPLFQQASCGRAHLY